MCKYLMYRYCTYLEKDILTSLKSNNNQTSMIFSKKKQIEFVLQH